VENFSAGVNDISGKLPPVLTTLAVNLPPVSTKTALFGYSGAWGKLIQEALIWKYFKGEQKLHQSLQDLVFNFVP
jgi:hypothetical protein